MEHPPADLDLVTRVDLTWLRRPWELLLCRVGTDLGLDGACVSDGGETILWVRWAKRIAWRRVYVLKWWRPQATGDRRSERSGRWEEEWLIREKGGIWERVDVSRYRMKTKLFTGLITMNNLTTRN